MEAACRGEGWFRPRARSRRGGVAGTTAEAAGDQRAKGGVAGDNGTGNNDGEGDGSGGNARGDGDGGSSGGDEVSVDVDNA